jgi:hypothetical protein
MFTALKSLITEGIRMCDTRNVELVAAAMKVGVISLRIMTSEGDIRVEIWYYKNLYIDLYWNPSITVCEALLRRSTVVHLVS